jgi:hypothetical protein
MPDRPPRTRLGAVVRTYPLDMRAVQLATDTSIKTVP